MAKRGLVAVVVGLRVVEGFGENLGCGLWKWSGEDSEAEDAIFVFDYLLWFLLSPTGERESGV